ncbi:MAG: hypothetical protein MJ185_06880 [Treponema sp.]|nr:hypothetical protein [Treponema sp.]
MNCKKNILTVCILLFFYANCFCQVSEHIITKDTGWIIGNTYENKFLYEEKVLSIKDFVSSEIKKVSGKKIPKEIEEQEIFLMEMYKNCKNFLDEPGVKFRNFEWYETENVKISIEYTIYGLWNNTGLGKYSIRVFDTSKVYVYSITDINMKENKSSMYDNLEKYLTFKEGRKADIQKGIEGNQGYYWNNENSCKEFYEDLKNKNVSGYALLFQNTFEECLNQIKDSFAKNIFE